jgi:hypothetical protein
MTVLSVKSVSVDSVVHNAIAVDSTTANVSSEHVCKMMTEKSVLKKLLEVRS